eukprot:2526583-Rhodomonas_salina.1
MGVGVGLPGPDRERMECILDVVPWRVDSINIDAACRSEPAGCLAAVAAPPSPPLATRGVCGWLGRRRGWVPPHYVLV